MLVFNSIDFGLNIDHARADLHANIDRIWREQRLADEEKRRLETANEESLRKLERSLHFIDEGVKQNSMLTIRLGIKAAERALRH